MTRAFARMYEIDPERLDLVEEFKARPFGPYGPELRRLVNGLRAGPVAGRYVLVCVERHKAWVLGRLTGRRGAAIEMFDDCRFTNLAAGEWEIFKRRWAAAAGVSLAGRVSDPVYGADASAGRR